MRRNSSFLDTVYSYSGQNVLAQRIPDFNESSTMWFKVHHKDVRPDSDDSQMYHWNVTNLRAYTKYHFRVLFDLSGPLVDLNGGFKSQPSLVARTQPGGTPSKPILHKVEQVCTTSGLFLCTRTTRL